MKRKTGLLFLLALALAAAPAGCGKKSKKNKDENKTPTTTDPGKKAAPATSSVPGVDMKGKVLTIGALNDESGPAKVVGASFAKGKRLLQKVVNAGPNDYLPGGWKIELVEKDHQYNPQHSVSGYEKIKNQVLFIATSFGTRPTLPLKGKLAGDNMVAFPASLSSLMASDEHTPPLGPSYKVEAMRAMDFAIENAKDKKKVKAAVIYQEDDYGKDGQAGWEQQAKHHEVKVVASLTVSADPKADMTAVVTQLKKTGATHVLLATLPMTTANILGKAAQLGVKDVAWIGQTPSWIDLFFSGKLVPPAIFGNFYWVQGLPYWGEDVPGMKKFLAAWEAHGKEMGHPDFYILASFVQGITQLEIFKKMLESGNVSRAGFIAAMHTLDSFTGGGMFQPVNLKDIPYQTTTRTRVLRPDFEKKTWKLVSDYASPAGMEGGK